jgi:intracellular septation protein A
MVDGWGYAWATLMFFLGAMNIFIAINFSAEIWGFYIVFVAMGAKLAMFTLQYWVFRRATIRRKAAAEASAGQEI